MWYDSQLFNTQAFQYVPELLIMRDTDYGRMCLKSVKTLLAMKKASAFGLHPFYS